ncbi:Chitinase [Commensalibacter communis]|uniref:peptidoglycan-binding protein n=1 Tax=Commensalibacter communis TaxID=2972786 RepID=UPI0022FF593E|nr:peptidoglycan-binding protein [Commensalibacter communis]CAI3945976.1 Chitinase [Commensalibacter communis]
MKNINQTVGLGGVNDPQDVSIIQALLQQQGAKNLKIDGIYGPNTLKAIKEFQKQFLTHPDGIVSPGKKTLEQLNNPTPPSSARPLSIPPDPLPLPPIQPWQNGGDKQQGSARDATRGAVYPQIVTIEMLDAVNPEGRNKQNREILPYINKYFSIYGISNPREIAHFLSQTAHESQFRNKAEDLDYTAKRMRQIYGCSGNKRGYDIRTDDCKPGHKRIRPMLWTEEQKYAHNPENLGNLVYNRKSLKNTKPGDGYKYRGRGIVQLTGKDKYINFTNTHNENNPNDNQDFVKNPDLVISSYEYAVEGTIIYWVGKEDLRKAAQNGTVGQVSSKINGGTIGIEDRVKRFNRVASLLGITQNGSKR